MFCWRIFPRVGTHPEGKALTGKLSFDFLSSSLRFLLLKDIAVDVAPSDSEGAEHGAAHEQSLRSELDTR